MTFMDAVAFATSLERQHYGNWDAGWRLVRIERTIGIGQTTWQTRMGLVPRDDWAVLLSRPQTGDYARVSDPYELDEFPDRLRILPRIEREEWPG